MKMKNFLLIALIGLSIQVNAQVRLSDLNVKESITGTEKIPVSGPGNPAITSNLLKSFLHPGTANQIAYWAGTNDLGALTTATYPSLSELAWVKGVTSSIQSQINGKQATLVSGTNIKTLEGNTLLGAGNIDLAASDVGLGSADNTSDADKPVSTATQTALNLKANIASPTFTGTVTIPTGGVFNTPASVNLSNGTSLPPTTGISGWPANAVGALTNNGSGTLTWSASGGSFVALTGTSTASGTMTLAMSTNPFIITSGVTTGTGATAGMQIAGNSLTTGNLLDISTTSLTSGKGLSIASTSTAINHTAGTNALFSSRISGANANASRSAIAGEFYSTNTGTTNVNYGLIASASGATAGSNYAAVFPAGKILIGALTSSISSPLSIEISNTDGGSPTNIPPAVMVKNTSSTAGTGAATYNIAGHNIQAGNGLVQGQLLANYGTPNAAPYVNGNGVYLTAVGDYPIYFATNNGILSGMIGTLGSSGVKSKSTAFGSGTVVAMAESTVMGYNAYSVLNDHTIGCGACFGGTPVIYGAYANGKGTSIGYEAYTNNREAIAVGPKAQATALATMAMGDGARAIPTGNATGGSFIWQTSDVGASGATLQTATTKMTLEASGNLTVTGAIAIGNTVNAVTPTLPNRTITIVVGGTTYYLAAKSTND